MHALKSGPAHYYAAFGLATEQSHGRLHLQPSQAQPTAYTAANETQRNKKRKRISRLSVDDGTDADTASAEKHADAATSGGYASTVTAAIAAPQHVSAEREITTLRERIFDIQDELIEQDTRNRALGVKVQKHSRTIDLIVAEV
jgi:hypothetical protein